MASGLLGRRNSGHMLGEVHNATVVNTYDHPDDLWCVCMCMCVEGEDKNLY